jgi:hypothetical protein
VKPVEESVSRVAICSGIPILRVDLDAEGSGRVERIERPPEARRPAIRLRSGCARLDDAGDPPGTTRTGSRFTAARIDDDNHVSADA